MTSRAPSALQHHFEDPGQQYASAGLGMWLFLVTEILFFGGLFAAYAVYRGAYPEAFAAASRHLPVGWGALNTAVLITSSFTMVRAVHAARMGQSSGTVKALTATLVLGTVFLLIKAVEYRDKFAHHLVPGADFLFHEVPGAGAEIFYSLYFAMTGLHALHMVIGIGILGVLTAQAARGRFSAQYNTPVDMAGLYWHFVDVVWIFLFPLLYLMGRV